MSRRGNVVIKMRLLLTADEKVRDRGVLMVLATDEENDVVMLDEMP